MRVYLAGGIFGLSDQDAKDWREFVKEELHHECVDPMVRDYRGMEDDNAEAIVTADLEDIDSCDAVLAYCRTPSWGTAMEVFYANSIGLMVIAVVPDKVSPWLRYHASVQHTLSAAVDLLNTYKEDE